MSTDILSELRDMAVYAPNAPGDIPGEVWTCSVELAFVTIVKVVNDRVVEKTILCQKWHTMRGLIEWRRVPTLTDVEIK